MGMSGLGDSRVKERDLKEAQSGALWVEPRKPEAIGKYGPGIQTLECQVRGAVLKSAPTHQAGEGRDSSLDWRG